MGAHISPLLVLTHVVSLERSKFFYHRNIHYYSEIFNTNELKGSKGSKCHVFRGRRRLLQQSNQWNSPFFSIVMSQ